MSEKKTRKLTSKQAKLVEGIIAGKTVAQAARDAGYSENHPENARQSGHQALKAVEDRVRSSMDRHGYTLDELIDKHLRLVLEGKETKFFPYRKTVLVPGKRGEQPAEQVVQVIDRINVVNLQTKATGLDIAFRLRGDYAPKKLDTEPGSSEVPELINVAGIPRFND